MSTRLLKCLVQYLHMVYGGYNFVLCIGAVDVNEVCLPCVVVFLACKLVLTVHPCIYPFYVCHRFVHVHCSQGHVLAAQVSHKKHTS